MNLRTYDWVAMTTHERQRVMLDLGYYLLEKASEPLDHKDLAKAMREYVEGERIEIRVQRAQWLRWSQRAINEHADHARANNPRAIESVRHKALLRHERLATKLELAVHKLLPSDRLTSTATLLDGFADDVRAATQAVRAIVDLDRLRAQLYRWADRAPDAIANEAEDAETLRLLAAWLTETTPERRAEIMALAREEMVSEDDIAARIGLH